MRNLPVSKSGRGELPSYVGAFIRRVFTTNDASEPVSAWRIAPEAELAALPNEDKKAYIAALLPLIRSGRHLQQRNLRRLYQLFAFIEIPAAQRLELLGALGRGPRARPEIVPYFRNRQLRRSLMEEAEYFASNAPSRAAYAYVALLRVRLNVKPGISRNLTRLFEKLTDVENRAASLLGKRGHMVRLDDRRLEIAKKTVAALGVPSAVLFPLGTAGLSVEGITTGLIALGGGFILPAGIAMVTGLGAAVAIGITTKRLLDMLMPTVDADRASIDVQQLGSGIVEIEHLLNEVAANNADPALREHTRKRIEEIMQRVAPLTASQRVRIELALEHARILGQRYIAILEQDGAALAQHRHALTHDLQCLLEIDRRAVDSSQEVKPGLE